MNCGHLNAEDSLFCESCGTKIVKQTSINECQNCHHTNEPEALFCESCGSKLDNTNKQTNKKVCSNCHQENDDNAMFCENCGQTLQPQVDNTVLTHQQPEPVNLQPVYQEPKKPMSKKNKILIGIVVVIMVALGGTYKFLDNKYSKQNQIDALITGIKDKDKSFLSKNISSDDPNLSIKESDLKPMITYFDENKDSITSLKTALEANSQFLGISLEQKGKNALIFPKYQLKVTPVYSTVTSNMKDSTIKMNGKKLFVTDSEQFSKKIGPLLLGNYKFDASIKDKKETVKETYTLLPGETETVDMSFVTVTIPIRSNVDEATVLMDDKEVGQLTDGKLDIGPIIWNGKASFQLVKKTKDGELKSDIKELTSTDVNKDGGTTSTIELRFETADKYEVSEGLKSFYNRFEQVVKSSNDYNPEEFAKDFYIDGNKNTAFKGINDYISWCRDRSAQGEYSGVDFGIVVKSVEPMSNNRYKVNYNVTYYTTYPSKTNKSKRVEGFDYSNVIVELDLNDKKDITNFKFVDMGDGGKKVSDNKANE